MVERTRVDLIAEPEHSFKYQTHNHVPLEQITRVNDEIAKLASYKVIRKTTPERGEFVSGFFAREKKDGSLRVILNLNSLNSYVLYKKFRMETFNKALTLITPNCYRASIVIYNAYFSVPITSQDQKCVKFKWVDDLYQYICYPNGTKKSHQTNRTYLWHITQLGSYISTGFLDDSLLVGKSIESCTQNIIDTVTLFDKLGFVVHPDKSILKPALVISYLGFQISSVSMIITLTEDREGKIIAYCLDIHDQPR